MYSDRIAEYLTGSFGPLPYLLLAFAWGVVLPLLLVTATVVIFVRRHAPSPASGFALGVAVAVWANVSWLCIPYCGVYPNLPGALLGALLFGVGTVGQEWTIHVANLVIWPLAGLAAFRSGLLPGPPSAPVP